MKFSILLFTIFLFPFLSAEERTWTDISGKEITGTWLRNDDQKKAVVLQIKGKEFTVPLARLSKQDHDWLTAQKEEREKKDQEFKALAGTTKSFPKDETHQVPFHVYYPKNYSAEFPPPMIFLFSPGGNGKDILSKFQTSCEELGWIGVGCDVFKNGVDDDELAVLFKELLPVVEKSVLHNPAQLYTAGFSGGASRAAWYTSQFERPWKGFISCGGWLEKKYDMKFRKKMAVAWVNGDKDKNANSWIQKDNDHLKKFRITTEEFPFPGAHTVAPPEVLTKAMRWVLENSKAE